MDNGVLVGVNLKKGAEIVKALDARNLKVNVALWLYSPDYEDWRLVLSSRRLDAAGPADAYGLVHDALETAGFTLENTPPVMILSTADPFVRGLRRTFGKARHVEGMRIAGQTIGDRFVQEAYVYRAS